jgi:Spermine/spermidine synthase domain
MGYDRPAMTSRPPFRVLVGVGLVAGCGLAQQVLLTRLFSAVLFYHFTFLAISLALLGTGAGGIAIYLWPRFFDRRPLEQSLARWTALFAALLVLTPLLLVRLDYTYGQSLSVRFVLNFGLACVLALLPFLCAGVAITLAIRGYTTSIGRIYAFDLAGAGIGALAVVPVMWIVAEPTGMMALGVLAAVAAVLFAGSALLARRVAVGVTAGGCAVVGFSLTTGLSSLPSTYFPNVRPTAVEWSPLNRVVGYAPAAADAFGYLFYDLVFAQVPQYHPGQPYPDYQQLLTSSQSVGLTTPPNRNVLVIGGGGGRDIYDALSSGARSVDVIELNSAIRDVVDRALGRYSGAPYSLPPVHTVIGDGRSVLSARSTKYDKIHIGFTDTLSGSSADAFALSENNLYTTEAFEEYYDHLAPGGMLDVTRPYHLVGDEALKITVLTLQSLQQRGVAHPENNVVVILGHDQFAGIPGTVLSQLQPFTAAQLAQIRALAAQRGDSIAFAPGGPYQKEWVGLHQSSSLHAFCSTYRLDVCAPTDDKPFFFNMRRLTDIAQPMPAGYHYTIDPFLLLGVTVGILVLLTLLAFGLPLGLTRGRDRPPQSSLVYFGAIGLGFLTLEIALIQRFVLFLGFPTYALSVVLFALLIFTGLGALLSSRWRSPRRALSIALAVTCGLIGLSAYLLQPLLRELITLPFSARVAVTIALLAPLGVLLGMAMPIGLRRLSELHPAGVAWAWGINGITSVLGSAVGIFVAINWGYAVTTLVALACYLVALAHAVSGRWPRPDRAPIGGPGEGRRRSRLRSRVPVSSGAAASTTGA